MKKLLLPIFLCVALAGFAQVNFVKKEWPALLKQAKAENKLIYLDAYTDWCGWCKVLDKEVFTDSAVSVFMNTHFINTKMEMEKEEWGKKIAMKYGVSGFPTGLVFNGDGKLLYVLTGYSPAKDYLVRLEESVVPANHLDMKGYSPGFDVKYPRMYLDVMAGNGKRKFADKKEVNEYLKAQKDPFSEASWSVWNRFQYKLDEENFGFFLNNYKKFAEYYGKQDVEDIISGRIRTYIDSAAKTNDQALYDKSLTLLYQYVSKPEEKKPWLEIHYYEKSKNWRAYGQKINEMINTGEGLKESSINTYAWNIYENCDDVEVIRFALSWMKKVVATTSNYDYLDTYAALLYKDHQYENALKYAEEAIQVAKRDNKKYEATEKLLEKIRAKK